ncbi:ABC transporter substrate-binding protein [Nocardia sp. NPDC002869]|uniref:ABC transporter substrate-binding protein n=1 Tax=Nocardia sp. NPDC002869 TaxID=3161032 RepID=UPI00398CFD3C
MKTDRPPFGNPDVRRAVMRMVDRAELVKVAFEGQGEVGNDVFGEGYQYYADLPQHEYDPDEAGRLLRRDRGARAEFRSVHRSGRLRVRRSRPAVRRAGRRMRSPGRTWCWVPRTATTPMPCGQDNCSVPHWHGHCWPVRGCCCATK